MSQTMNGNGNGSTTAVQALPLPRPLASKEAHVTFTGTDGIALRGTLVRMSRHAATFKLYGPNSGLNHSEVLTDFSVNFQGKSIYLGRAVIRSLVDAGTKTVCDVTLDEKLWQKANPQLLSRHGGQIAKGFKNFLLDWQKFYAVSPEFKLAVADMETFLCDLQLWLNQLELQMKLKGDHPELEIIAQLADAALPAIDDLFEKFESVAKSINSEHRAAHASYMRQHLHPFVLCAPFAYRTFGKPRGYAGDYEMVNMIIRNGLEGDSLFAKILHYWFVSQPPAKAHRNRIKYLAGHIERASYRVARAGRPARIFNFACGPAAEMQELINTRTFPSRIDFTLADFDGETLEYVERSLKNNEPGAQSSLRINYRKMSVHQLIKECRRLVNSDANKFDLVYCAGLFDYLPDTSCKELMNVLYNMVVPGGLLIATNVEPSNPLRFGMEYLLDWHLIYRNDKQMREIRPDESDEEDARICTDATGVNLFLEVAKPDNG